MAEGYFEFVKHEGLKKAKVIEREIRKEFVPEWKARPIHEITQHDLAAVINSIKKRGANAQAHTLFERARSLWRWAPDLRSALMTQNGRHANAINAPPSAQSATTSQGGTCHMNSNRNATIASAKSPGPLMPAVHTGL